MKSNPLEEAIRLTRQFFPESKPYVNDYQGVFWNDFLRAMCDTRQGGYDASNDFWVPPEDFPLQKHLEAPISETGILDEPYHIAFSGILKLADFNPSGRTLIIPDSFRPDTQLRDNKMPDNKMPIVCAFKTAPQRLEELYENNPCLWGGNDTIFIFESGEAFIVDHDLRLWWAKSQLNQTFS